MNVGIITAPRSTNYLSRSLDSYFREWDIQPTIFEEPGTLGYNYRSRCRQVRNEERLGIVGNWINAAKVLLADLNSEWIMICEDDIEWRPGSAHILRSMILDRAYSIHTGFISAYTCVENAMRDFHAGSWHKPYFINNSPEHWCGACAMVFPRDVLSKLIYHYRDEFLKNCTLAHSEPVHLDCGISKTLYDHGLSGFCHSPSLVVHKGEISTNESNNGKEVVPPSRRTAI